MIKILGNVVVLGLLLFALVSVDEGARTVQSQQYLAGRIGLYGILSLGAGLLIITGGIDLSIGSTVALAQVLMSKFMIDWQLPAAAAIPMVLMAGMVIGLVHGLLVTVARVQAFVVTLCGLFIYRSLARWIARDNSVGLNIAPETRDFFNGEVLGVPMHFVILLGLVVLLGIMLHFTVYGRYFYAIGSNEKAARYCGIATTRYKILAYILCSTLTCLFAVLNMMKMQTAQPSSTGTFFELYGIAAAVIGGCSLRGGEGTIVGIFLGTCIIWVLPTLIRFIGFPSYFEESIFGTVLLLAAFFDELLRRYQGYRNTT